MADQMAMIDAEQLVERYTVEQLAATAEQYFASMASSVHLQAKPFGAVSEAPLVLAHLSALLSALELSSGMTLLDFGAGSCWTSRCFTQLGCRVIATDVSPTALSIGRELFQQQPVVGAHLTPTFLVFDGHRFELADESVDRVACMDAFHHVPNWDEVLAEMCRVLRPGGRAVLAESGPHHSRTAQAQAEMRAHAVVERDIVVEDLAHVARAAGFEEVLVAIYAGVPHLVPSSDFQKKLNRGRVAADAARAFLENHRLLVLRKAGEEILDSRRIDALAGDLSVRITDRTRAFVRATNTGRATWLSGAQLGAVNVGIHRFDAAGSLVDLDFHRQPLVAAPATHVRPGETVELDYEVPALPPGTHILEFDLVAEGVAWFAIVGGKTARVVIES
jgi:2-polyprenyl-3-methyl-5-hydroxy-6-metoxy-1,4-benzoquinol methylase